MKLVEGCLRERKDRDNRFHHWGGAVNLVQAGVSAGKVRDGSFNYRGDL